MIFFLLRNFAGGLLFIQKNLALIFSHSTLFFPSVNYHNYAKNSRSALCYTRNKRNLSCFRWLQYLVRQRLSVFVLISKWYLIFTQQWLYILMTSFVLFLSAVVPRSKSPREPDVFELPPLPSTSSAANEGWG